MGTDLNRVLCVLDHEASGSSRPSDLGFSEDIRASKRIATAPLRVDVFLANLVARQKRRKARKPR
jgi:hypothetical protein